MHLHSKVNLFVNSRINYPSRITNTITNTIIKKIMNKISNKTSQGNQGNQGKKDETLSKLINFGTVILFFGIAIKQRLTITISRY